MYFSPLRFENAMTHIYIYKLDNMRYRTIGSYPPYFTLPYLTNLQQVIILIQYQYACGAGARRNQTFLNRTNQAPKVSVVLFVQSILVLYKVKRTLVEYLVKNDAYSVLSGSLFLHHTNRIQHHKQKQKHTHTHKHKHTHTHTTTIT